MTGTEAAEMLIRFYGRKLSDDLRRYYAEVLDESADTLRPGIVKHFFDTADRLPPIREIRQYVRDENHRRDEWMRSRSTNLWPTEFKEGNPLHAKESFALIREFMSRKIPRPERARRMREMHARWPGRGWDVAADATEKGLDAEDYAIKHWDELVPARPVYPGPRS